MFTGYNVLFILITILWPKGSSDNTYPATCDDVFFKLICSLVPHRLGALTRVSKKKIKKKAPTG